MKKIIFIILSLFVTEAAIAKKPEGAEGDNFSLGASLGLNIFKGITGQVDMRIYRYFSLGAMISYIPETEIYSYIKNILPVGSISGSQTLSNQTASINYNATLDSIKLSTISAAAAFDFYPWAGVFYTGFNAGMTSFSLKAKANSTITTSVPNNAFPAEVINYINQNGLNGQNFNLSLIASSILFYTYISPHIGFYVETFPKIYIGTELGADIIWSMSIQNTVLTDTNSSAMDSIVKDSSFADKVTNAMDGYAGQVKNLPVIPYWNVLKVGIML